MINKALIVLAVSAVAVTTAFGASTKDGIITIKNNRFVIIDHPTGPYVSPRLDVPGSQKIFTNVKIFSNLGYAYPDGVYNCCYGNTISGSGSGVGQIWAAVRFDAAGAFKLREIDVGVGYLSGTNQINISIYKDGVGGVPTGTPLYTAVATGLSGFGSCCTLTTLRPQGMGTICIPSGTYWLALSTEGDNTSYAAWNQNTTEMIVGGLMAVNYGSGWVQAGFQLPAPAFAVVGKPKPGGC